MLVSIDNTGDLFGEGRESYTERWVILIHVTRTKYIESILERV